MSEENKALVRRFVEEAQSRGNIEAVDEFLAEDFVDHGAFPGVPPNREGVKPQPEHKAELRPRLTSVLTRSTDESVQ
ncbi:MAG: hypothetical protein H0T57_07065 [Rubrobacter sp.]|nr:hypothetical protein [Rubrobacter sp.]MDQ3636536.1 ester cyclase [Actinomycetota bacterium]